MVRKVTIAEYGCRIILTLFKYKFQIIFILEINIYIWRQLILNKIVCAYYIISVRNFSLPIIRTILNV